MDLAGNSASKENPAGGFRIGAEVPKKIARAKNRLFRTPRCSLLKACS